MTLSPYTSVISHPLLGPNLRSAFLRLDRALTVVDRARGFMPSINGTPLSTRGAVLIHTLEDPHAFYSSLIPQQDALAFVTRFKYPIP